MGYRIQIEVEAEEQADEIIEYLDQGMQEVEITFSFEILKIPLDDN